MLQIYHNSRCSKSRECLAILENSDAEYQVINYLKELPSATQLKELIKKLNIKPIDMIRRNETIWKENFANKMLDDEQLIEAMVAYPILIERPIVVNGNKAVIARPPSRALEII